MVDFCALHIINEVVDICSFVNKSNIKNVKMRTALQVELTFDQILSLVKQLPKKQQIKLTKELEKDTIDSKLSALLKSFKTKDLDLKTISDEVDIVRKEIYDKQKG